MENTVISTVRVAISIIITAALITISTVMVNRADSKNIERENRSAIAQELFTERSWRKYEGTVTGADVVDFIVTHRNSCAIVIRNSSYNNKVTPYVSNGALVMGLSGNVNIPDTFWTLSYAYDYIINGKGEQKYQSVLLYNGALSSGNSDTIGQITGIEFAVK